MDANTLSYMVATSIVGSLMTLLVFIIQKRVNSRSDEKKDMNTDSETIKNLMETIRESNTLNRELSDEMDRKREESREEREEAKRERDEAKAEIQALEGRLDDEVILRKSLAEEVKQLKNTFEIERKKLVEVIADLLRQLQDAGVTPDTTLLDKAGVYISKKRK